MAASATAAGVGSTGSSYGKFGTLKGYVPSELLSAIQQNPKQSFDVIVQGDRREKSRGFIQKIIQDKRGNSSEDVGSGSVKREFTSITGGRMTLTGWQILFLAKSGVAKAILANETVQKSAVQLPLYNRQLWPWAAGAPVDWTRKSPAAPTIAIVDSGIDASKLDVAGRVLGQVNLASLAPNSPGDGYGHGTFVAGIAAGSAPGYAGVAPKANLLSLDVMADNGQATVADVVAAADWILKNKATYNIKVANFSLHAVNRASILFDPLDQAVERLWLNGVVVVAASGNYGTAAGPSGVGFAPGNDPFIITVGAADIGNSVKPGDDTVAPWSAWGYTGDGFMKPDIGAPGRYMIGPVPTTAALTTLRPDHVTSPGYMQLSGTSFSAPVVAGAAAMLLAQHPNWTPDQVKGALMVTAKEEKLVPLGALGVGAVNVAAAREYKGENPPNPNAGLNQYLTKLADGTVVFDPASWQVAAKANPAWNAAAWSDAAWSSAAWASAAWADAAWASVAWASAAWGSAAWSDVAWSDAAWSDAAWADNAGPDPVPGLDATAASIAEQELVQLELGIVNPDCDPTLEQCIADPVATVIASPPATTLP
jgi:serine protease AprX